MNNKVKLKTSRLILRPILLEDFSAIYNYSKDDEWGQYMDPHTLEHVENLVCNWVTSSWDISPRFSIMLNSNVIGGTGLYIDVGNNIAEIGYSLAKNYWGKGYITEATTEVMRWGFEDLKLYKIFARANAENFRSLNVMGKLGMNQEALLKGHNIIRGKRKDEVVFSILKDNWKPSNRLQ